MLEDQNERSCLVVWVYTTKYINKLKRYGLVHYVSKKMNYAILYIDKKDKESVQQNLSKQHFVKKVEESYQCEMPKTFDGVLDEVRVLAAQRKKEDESKEISIFNQLSSGWN
ncbi:YlbG family protein [Marinilactibacillus sp. GCM10026970]|uniref:YlbG family protein n=1 Tax=unclassified Marinilactibacillus TaxID=2632303 RepID=UPI001CE491CD|nr:MULTISPECIES: YlbG family protein [unclassified Marinilactibacillus]MEC6747549.1 YlbG family protein [Marinilactibacillus sp. XAAS-LB27]